MIFRGFPIAMTSPPFHPRQESFKSPPLPLLAGEKVIELEPDADFPHKAYHRKSGELHKA